MKVSYTVIPTLRGEETEIGIPPETLAADQVTTGKGLYMFTVATFLFIHLS